MARGLAKLFGLGIVCLGFLGTASYAEPPACGCPAEATYQNTDGSFTFKNPYFQFGGSRYWILTHTGSDVCALCACGHSVTQQSVPVVGYDLVELDQNGYFSGIVKNQNTWRYSQVTCRR